MDQIARTPKQLGALIQRRRRLLQMSQSEAADRAGLRQEMVSKIESGSPGTAMCRNALDRCTITSGGCDTAEQPYGTVTCTGPPPGRHIPHSIPAERWLSRAAGPA